jgi:hypothetical protein
MLIYVLDISYERNCPGYDMRTQIYPLRSNPSPVKCHRALHPRWFLNGVCILFLYSTSWATSDVFFSVVDGTTNDIPLALKWSTTILGELLDRAGTASWSAWKTKQRQAGLPILENYGRAVEKHDPLKPKKKQSTKGQAQVKPKPKSTTGEAPVEVEDLNVSAETKADLDKARSGTGAAAILP